jgi:hypothetical protein
MGLGGLPKNRSGKEEERKNCKMKSEENKEEER